MPDEDHENRDDAQLEPIDNLDDELSDGQDDPYEIVLRQTSSWIGPVPNPDDLQRFGEIDPSFPNRLIEMAEKEQAHRHRDDAETNANIFKLHARGQFIGVLLGILGIGGIVWISLKAPALVGVTAVGSVALVVGYLRGKSSPDDE